jgi:3D (Asp-Asp-Asp) domain-containing protein
MHYFPKLAAAALTGLLLATGCTSAEDKAVAADPTVMELQTAVELQRKVVVQIKYDTYREEELLKAKESQLAAARHEARADEAIK